MLQKHWPSYEAAQTNIHQLKICKQKRWKLELALFQTHSANHFSSVLPEQIQHIDPSDQLQL